MISNFARGFQKFHFFWCWIQTIVFGWQELLHSKIWKKNMAVQVAPVGKTMKVKVVKWCRKKWNKPNLMYIYHKQSEIMQKNQWNSSNGQLHWFLIDFLWKWSIMDQNANVFFLCHVKSQDFFCKVVASQKKTWLQFFVSSPHIESAWSQWQNLKRKIVAVSFFCDAA